MSCKLGSFGDFEDAVLHCISNNPKNDNFSFSVGARDDNECLEVLKNVNETKGDLEIEISKIIGKCTVLIDFDKSMVVVKRVQ